MRVPTHEDGSCLFWEFATDYYDIGFGVYFEWTIAPSNTVSVHVSESSDEEELEEEGKLIVAIGSGSERERIICLLQMKKCKMHRFRSSCTCAKYHLRPSCSKLTMSLVNESLKL